MAILFGSYATETVTPVSDLDVAIKFHDELTPDRRRARLDELTGAIMETTSIDAADLVDLDGVGPYVGYRALRDGQLLVGDRLTAVNLESAFLVRKLDFQPVKTMWGEVLERRIRGGTYGRP